MVVGKYAEWLKLGLSFYSYVSGYSVHSMFFVHKFQRIELTSFQREPVNLVCILNRIIIRYWVKHVDLMWNAIEKRGSFDTIQTFTSSIVWLKLGNWFNNAYLDVKHRNERFKSTSQSYVTERRNIFCLNQRMLSVVI